MLPKRKKPASPEPETKQEEQAPQKNSQYYEISIPKIPLPRISMKEGSYTPLLVVLLFFAFFGLGMLTTKVQYLQKNGTTPTVPAQQTAAAGTQQGAPTPVQKATVDFGHFPVKGDSNAKVAIVEFADLRCPFCKRFYDDAEQQIIKDYVDTGKVKLAFRHYEFLGPASVTAGNAAECAQEQNKFWDFYNYMYKNQPDESDTSMFTTEKLSAIAGDLGMDTSQFSSCLDSKKYDKNVSDDFAAGQAAGVTGTPTFIIGKINGNKVEGNLLVGAMPYDSFKQALDQALSQ